MALIELSPILIFSAAEDDDEKKTGPKKDSRTIVRSPARHCLRNSEWGDTVSTDAENRGNATK